jgi:hypothetical protein
MPQTATVFWKTILGWNWKMMALGETKTNPPYVWLGNAAQEEAWR